MQPRLIIKQINNAVDMVQQDIEASKDKKDLSLFKEYMEILDLLKQSKKLLNTAVNLLEKLI